MSSPFQIGAPFIDGINTDIDPYLLPETSFSVLSNCHVRYGQLQRRLGVTEFGLLYNEQPQKNAITGISALADPPVLNNFIVRVAHSFKIGDTLLFRNQDTYEIFNVIGVPNPTSVLVDKVIDTQFPNQGSLSRLSQVIEEAITGITIFIQNNIPLNICFNTKRIYARRGNRYVSINAQNQFDGDAQDLVWSYHTIAQNINPTLYFTNGKPRKNNLNGIYQYNGTAVASFAPTLRPGRTLIGCKLIAALRGRLICFNTYEMEGDEVEHFPVRIRWSAGSNQVDKWSDVVIGEGGFLDIEANAEITSLTYLRDDIVICLNNSTYLLRSTNNPLLPFYVDLLNSFRGCQARFGMTAFESYAVAFGSEGLFAISSETQRIDAKISRLVTDQIANFKSTVTLRNFFTKRWWTLLSIEPSENAGNNLALIQDEDSGAFSTYDLLLTTLGYGTNTVRPRLSDFGEGSIYPRQLSDYIGTQTTLKSFLHIGDEAFLLGGTRNGKILRLENEVTENKEVNFVVRTSALNPFKKEQVLSRLLYVDILIDRDPFSRGICSFFTDNHPFPPIVKEFDFIPPQDRLADIHTIQLQDNSAILYLDNKITNISVGDQVYIYQVIGLEGINGESAKVLTVTPFYIEIDLLPKGSYSHGGILANQSIAVGGPQFWQRIHCNTIAWRHTIEISITTYSIVSIYSITPYFTKEGGRKV